MERTESKINEKSASKSVRFSEETDRKFNSLAEKLGCSKQELFGQMVDYFYKSKKDPSDLNDEILKKEISKGISRIISFIQTQEKESLAPILAEVREGNQHDMEVLQEQRQTWQKFLEQFSQLYYHDMETKKFGGTIAVIYNEIFKRGQLLGEMAEALKKQRQEIVAAFDEQRRNGRSLQSQKESFRLLLENYMAQRENINSIMLSKDKISQLQNECFARFEKL